LSGDVIKVQYREEEPKEYKIETFFEDHFNYKLHQSGGFIFTFANHMISQIDDIATDAKLSENNRTSKLITLVKYIEFEIINSDKCQELDNTQLYPQLQKFKLNFIRIYNEIFDLYSQYFPKYTKNDFGPVQIIKKKKIKNLKDSTKKNPQQTENPHPRVFKSLDAYVFFESIKEMLCKDMRTILADYSFIFRRMKDDKYIYEYVEESEFRDFLNDFYEVDLDKLKTFKKYNDKSVIMYNYLKSL
jgi:hypothetical protein